MFNLRSLELFYWAAHLRSFSRAAQKLHTTQPALSQRIGGIEQLVGEPLFDRTAKPIALTATGRVLFAHAEVLLRQIATMENDLKMSDRFEGTVRLGVSETIVQTWLAPFLEQVARRFPKLDIDITVDITPSMLDALKEGELDMAFMLGPYLLEGFKSRKLRDYALKFYALPGLVPDNRLSFGSWSSPPIITYPRHSYPYIFLREVVLSETGKSPRVFANSSISSIEKMAMDGLGVALIAEGTLSSASLSRLEVVESNIELTALSFYAYYQSSVRGDIFERLAGIALEIASANP